MDKILTLLQSLLSLNKVASVSVPGIVAAVALTMIWWPPRPEDRIPIVVSETTVVSQTTNQQQGLYQQDSVIVPNIVPKEKACTVKMQPLDSPKSWLGDFWSSERKNQPRLDDAKDKIAQCIEREMSWKGFEKTRNDHLALDIADLQKVLTATLDTYSNYEKSDNPLAARFKARAETHQKEISELRLAILQNEQSMRNRDLYLAELARYDKIISDRLADPDRLRPRKTFDDFLASLINHVVAFVLLGIALGVVLTPINQVASGFFYDQLFPKGH